MVFFLIGSNVQKRTIEETWREMQKEGGIQDSGPIPNGNAGRLLNLEKDSFKLGNLDTLMFYVQTITKLDTNIEGLLKKIERQASDLDKTFNISKFEIDTRENARQTIDKYVFNFKWDEAKYSRNNIADMLKNLNGKVTLIDTDLRQQILLYQEKATMLNQITKKDGGSLVTKDLTDILKQPVVRPDDFIYTAHLTTMVAIVPRNASELWNSKYETYADYVVPQSTKLFNYEDKDGYTIWRVILFKSIKDEFVERAKQDKIIVREFNYSIKANEEKEQLRIDLKTQTESLSTKLLEKCSTYFSELYQAYVHIKVLKLLVDCIMRFGIKEPIVTVVVKPQEGKEKKLHQGLTKLLADAHNLQTGLYGSKEEIDDTEDFYPYAFVPLNIPA